MINGYVTPRSSIVSMQALSIISAQNFLYRKLYFWKYKVGETVTNFQRKEVNWERYNEAKKVLSDPLLFF